MKLHQTFLSPFPTRVRLVLYFKGIDVEFVEPPGIHDLREVEGQLSESQSDRPRARAGAR